MKATAYCAALQSQIGAATSDVERTKCNEDAAGDAYIRALSEKQDAQIGVDMAVQLGDAAAIAEANSIYASSCQLVERRTVELSAAQDEYSKCFNHYKDLEFEFENNCR
jgi:hypothetical protein